MFETRAVLAGAYAVDFPSARLTHSADPYAATVACGRVNFESLADVHADDPNAAPTCPKCRRLDSRFKGEAAPAVKSFEVRARERLDSFDHKGDRASIGIVETFRAKMYSALPIRRIVAIASAMVDRELGESEIRAALRAMVRGKILRSRPDGGETVWEVNA